MARTSSSLDEAFVVIEILKRLPRDKSRRTISEIRESLAEGGIDLSVRTLQRYLKAISEDDRFGVECDKREKPFGYRIGASKNSLGEISLTPAESLLLRLAQEHMQYQMPASVTKSLGFLFDEASNRLNESAHSKKQREWLRKVGIASGTIPQVAPKIKQRIFEAVSDALFSGVKLEIEYVNKRKGLTHAYVSPLGLVQQEVRLYLVCQFDGYEDIRHLALHRIQKAKVSTFAVERPKGFELSTYIRTRHFNYSNGEHVHWTVEFSDPATAVTLEETPFNLTQKITQLPDGFYRMEVDIEDSRLLDGWVAMWKEQSGIRLSTREPIETKKPESAEAGAE